MAMKAPNLKQQVVWPPFQSVIMKTTRVPSATDVVTDNHVITNFKHCSLFCRLGGSCICLVQLRGKIGKEIRCNFIAVELLRVIQALKSRHDCCFSEWLHGGTYDRGLLVHLPQNSTYISASVLARSGGPNPAL